MVEVNESILFPEGVPRCFPSDHFAGMLEEQEQELNGLFLELDQAPLLP